MRSELFARDPLCAECTRQGRVTLATQRDHIKALAEGGADDASNVQGLCTTCAQQGDLHHGLHRLSGGRAMLAPTNVARYFAGGYRIRPYGKLP